MSEEECDVVFAINESEEQIARNIVRLIQHERQTQPSPSMAEDTMEQGPGGTTTGDSSV